MSARLELDYILGGVVTYPPGATFGPRVLNDFELVWIIQGDVVYQYDNADIPAPPGAMILARPGFHDAFVWDPRQPTRHAYFHFNAATLPSDWPSPERWPVCQIMPDHDVIRPLFRYVLNICDAGRNRPSPMAARAVETLLGAFIVGPVGTAEERESDLPEPVSRAMRFVRSTLESDPRTPMTLRSLARAAAVSDEHLCRLFRSAMGTGPMEAVRLLRLDMAVGLLARSNLNVEQVGHRCGFPSPHHFSRRFRRVYGFPPGSVRKRLALGQAPPISPLVRRAQPPKISRMESK